jgi:F-type H+-transporting ATPase subunit b
MDLINPSFGLVVWTSIAFLTLLVVLTKFAWKPILGALKDREESIEEALKAAEIAKSEMAQLSADNEKLLLDAKAERDALLKQAQASAAGIVTAAKDTAVEEGQKLIEKARIAIESEKVAAVNQLKTQAVSLSIEIAEKVLQNELADKSAQEKLVQDLIVKSDLSSF